MARSRALLVAGLLACDETGSRPDGAVDVASGDVAPEVGPVDPCAEAPVLSWDNFAAGFLVENCQSCHARAAVDRHDAPDDIVFDTLEDTLALRERIRILATGDDPEMPPAGGVSEADRALLASWLRCGVEAQ